MNSNQKAQHTPGPWILQTADSDLFVEVVDSATEGRVLTTLIANERGYSDARLIAAAPELLAALKAAERLLNQFSSACTRWEREPMPQIRAAIAKAEGRT